MKGSFTATAMLLIALAMPASAQLTSHHGDAGIAVRLSLGAMRPFVSAAPPLRQVLINVDASIIGGGLM
jgi:hypothetical protein